MGWLWSSDTEEIEIAVFGMACGNCESTVERVLEDVEPVRSAEADREAGRAWVEAEPELDVDRLLAVVRSVGYEARRP